MTIAEVTQLVLSVATLLTSATAAIVATKALIQVGSTHKLVNGQSDALLDLKERQGHARGVEEERNRPT